MFTNGVVSRRGLTTLGESPGAVHAATVYSPRSFESSSSFKHFDTFGRRIVIRADELAETTCDSIM